MELLTPLLNQDLMSSLIDISEASLERGMNTIAKNLDRMVAKEKITEADKARNFR